MKNTDSLSSKCEPGSNLSGSTESAKNGISHKKEEHDADAVRQQARYSTNDEPAPDNNIFFEERSNPLSSKGN